MSTKELVFRLYAIFIVRDRYSERNNAESAILAAALINKEYNKYESRLMMGEWDSIIEELGQ